MGVYALMERFVAAFPDILWESCSGGGGRFDAGILYYMPQIWCSDNTDAIERLQIQYGTSFGGDADLQLCEHAGTVDWRKISGA